MPCLHRFHNELIPKHKVQFLFFGTFNPIWNVKKGDNPDYFYSRAANQFWCMLPHALNQNCLIDKSRKEKEEFCVVNKIGLSDIIYNVKNVNEEDTGNEYLKKGFKDENFETIVNGKYVLDLVFNTADLKKYISQNSNALKGVFLTRKTFKDIPRIWKEWIAIKELCASLNIVAQELPSPSPRGGGIREKIFKWRNVLKQFGKLG